jgi:hypothetical protein
MVLEKEDFFLYKCIFIKKVVKTLNIYVEIAERFWAPLNFLIEIYTIYKLYNKQFFYNIFIVLLYLIIYFFLCYKK